MFVEIETGASNIQRFQSLQTQSGLSGEGWLVLWGGWCWGARHLTNYLVDTHWPIIWTGMWVGSHTYPLEFFPWQWWIINQYAVGVRHWFRVNCRGRVFGGPHPKKNFKHFFCHFYPIWLHKLALSPKNGHSQFTQNQILTPTGK